MTELRLSQPEEVVRSAAGAVHMNEWMTSPGRRPNYRPRGFGPQSRLKWMHTRLRGPHIALAKGQIRHGETL